MPTFRPYMHNDRNGYYSLRLLRLLISACPIFTVRQPIVSLKLLLILRNTIEQRELYSYTRTT